METTAGAGGGFGFVVMRSAREPEVDGGGADIVVVPMGE